MRVENILLAAGETVYYRLAGWLAGWLVLVGSLSGYIVATTLLYSIQSIKYSVTFTKVFCIISTYTDLLYFQVFKGSEILL